MPERLVSTTCLGNLNDPSYELLLRRKLGGVFEVDELLLDWDQADVCAFVGATELGRTVDVRLDAADGGRLTDGDVLAIDRSGMVPVAVVVRLRSAEVYSVEVDRMDPIALAHACWEIGNMHAPLFRGDSDEHTVRMYTPARAGVYMRTVCSSESPRKSGACMLPISQHACASAIGSMRSTSTE